MRAPYSRTWVRRERRAQGERARRASASCDLPTPPVRVLDAHDVVQVIRGHLEDVTVLQRDHPVLAARSDMMRLPRAKRHLLEPAVVALDDEGHDAGLHEDRFFLLIVILQRQPMSAVDMQDLTGIAIGARPEELI